MNTSGVKRKLTAILSADVAGYSRLMGRDEVGTVQILKRYRQIMATLIDKAHGRVVDSPGDNLLAEFASVVDAVHCADTVQQALKSRNAELTEDRRMQFRIGINLGDVIEDGDRIYGDGINIAARLESLAEPGGICISGTVYDQVKNKLPLEYNNLGKQNVKNIAEPVRTYRVIQRKPDDARKAGSKKRPSGMRLVRKIRRSLSAKLLITCLAMIVVMPFVNSANLNLLTKILQCRLALLPNAGKVVLVTIGADEYKKMNTAGKQEKPPPYLSNPKVWRRYHPTVIKKLYELQAEAVGFDFWFPPAYDDPAKQATAKFVAGLRWARKQKFPVVVGQAQNMQDPDIYKQVDWGYISLYKDLTWINKIMYLYAWDKMDFAGVKVKKPALFVQVLAQKLRLPPVIDSRNVRVIGRPIPKRLWLAFAKTPFTSIPYHEVYNGWADKKLFAGKIVLIGLGLTATDYFQTPYSPTDFTPGDKDDAAGMPGVFLFAHAINQIVNGYYHAEINDEWFGTAVDGWFSAANLQSFLFLLIETVGTCLLLYAAFVLTGRTNSVKWTLAAMSSLALALITILAVTPILFGLVNIMLAALVFIPLCMATSSG
jgi:class 3 adenylate cyclase